eukprot:TRINITY_DN10684_c0_g1_i1.p1 TRINITY_DN10684_c0_g1~~TRINITY_DN10684_c0_g1_i1.p1  ORF type:complete len:169 (+),score=32.37 TRINITY_DN10684_c0_g1_i1:54-560(+)
MAGRQWVPPQGHVRLATQDNLTEEEKQVAKLKASLSNSKEVPLPPGMAPPPPEPGAIEKLIALCLCDSWKVKLKEWATAEGVTPELVSAALTSEDKPLQIMSIYNSFLESFNKALLRHCHTEGITEDQLQVMCQECLSRNDNVSDYLKIVLDQTDFLSFVKLLNENIE